MTGAGRGIGLGAAAALAQAGAHVTLCARSPEELDALRDAIRRDGGGAETLTLDITDVASTMAALESCPPFDILVNNAGTNRIAPFTQVGLGDFDAVFALNVKASYFVAQSVARRLMAAGRTGASGAKQPFMRKQHLVTGTNEQKADQWELGSGRTLGRLLHSRYSRAQWSRWNALFSGGGIH